MEYTVNVEASMLAVVVRHEHPMGDSYLQSRDDLIENIRESGYTRALVVLDGAGFGSNTSMIHEHISYLASGLPLGVKVAAVMKPSEADEQSRGFAEIVASNRGLNLKTFDDESAALQWLQAGR